MPSISQRSGRGRGAESAPPHPGGCRTERVRAPTGPGGASGTRSRPCGSARRGTGPGPGGSGRAGRRTLQAKGATRRGARCRRRRGPAKRRGRRAKGSGDAPPAVSRTALATWSSAGRMGRKRYGESPSVVRDGVTLSQVAAVLKSCGGSANARSKRTRPLRKAPTARPEGRSQAAPCDGSGCCKSRAYAARASLLRANVVHKSSRPHQKAYDGLGEIGSRRRTGECLLRMHVSD